MADKAYFSPRAIKANEDAVRKMFAAKPGDGPGLAALSRIGQRVGPAAMRALLDEVNRGTPDEVAQNAYATIIGWMIANTVASIPDGPARMKVLGASMALIEHHALAYAMGNNIVEPPREAYGEAVGGHA